MPATPHGTCNKQCKDQRKENVAQASMFFAGLILLIPHRIGMSRVNYVIKRYNLPISRAVLLLYKYHNNTELSLTIGTVIGIIITIAATAYVEANGAGNTGGKWRNGIAGCMVGVLIFNVNIIHSYVYNICKWW